MKKRSVIPLLILLMTTLIFGQHTDYAILDSISANYLAQVPFQLEYKITQHYAQSEAVQEQIGQFYLHNQDVFRVNYPGSQILFDGTWLWSIDKVNYQIVVEEFDPSSSLRLIYNVLNGNMSEYEAAHIENITQDDELLQKVELKSLDENSFFKSMNLTINPELREIKTVEYVDFQGTSIIIDFLEHYKHRIDEKVLFEVKNIQEDDFIDLRP